VVVTSFEPLRIYVYREGLVRFASERYSNQSVHDARSKFSHLTNYSINKTNEASVNVSSCIEGTGFKWTLSDLCRKLEAEGIEMQETWNKVYDTITKSILSIDEQTRTELQKTGLDRNNCFELLGFDILLDNNLSPWLLEINHSPSLSFDTVLDLKLKSSMIQDTFNLIGLRLPHSKVTVSQ